jgi:ActR/RegA family two-component response regulator
MNATRLDVLFVAREAQSILPFQEALRGRGARARTAPSTDEGLRLVRDTRPDLIVVDEPLGENDAADRLRSACPDAEMIVLTQGATGTPSGIGLGLLLCAVKPVSVGTLLDIVGQTFPTKLGPPAAPTR